MNTKDIVTTTMVTADAYINQAWMHNEAADEQIGYMTYEAFPPKKE